MQKPIADHDNPGRLRSRPKTAAIGCGFLADQRIPMDDGISLSADVSAPKRPDLYPVIVQFAAYSRELHTRRRPDRQR
jgi:uncharacterized protein